LPPVPVPLVESPPVLVPPVDIATSPALAPSVEGALVLLQPLTAHVVT
jgi:hypothetical protein